MFARGDSFWLHLGCMFAMFATQTSWQTLANMEESGGCARDPDAAVGLVEAALDGFVP